MADNASSIPMVLTAAAEVLGLRSWQGDRDRDNDDVTQATPYDGTAAAVTCGGDEADAQSAVLSAVSQRVPMKEHRARAHVSIGVGFATMSCLVDGILSYPFAVARWQCAVAIMSPDCVGVDVSLPVLGTHVLPWLCGQGSSGLSAWRSMGWGTLSEAVFHGTRLWLWRQRVGRRRRWELRPPRHVGIDLVAACVVLPLEAAKYRAAVLGWSGGIVDLARLSMHGVPLMSPNWMLTPTGLHLVALSVCFTVAKSELVAAITRSLSAPLSTRGDDEPQTMVTLYAQPLRSLVVADVLATVMLLPLEMALVRGHVLAAQGSCIVPGTVADAALRATVALAVESVVRGVHMQLTTVVMALVASDISPEERDASDDS